MKYTFLLVLSFLIGSAEFSCRSVSVTNNELKTESIMNKPQVNVEFSEVRRLNRDVQLSDFLIIKDFSETVKLYGKLEDKRFSRSVPIPTLEENEFFLLLKPIMKKQVFGDLEITKMEIKGSVLNIYYKEISNEEYLLNKQKNPILILRVNGVAPSSVKLINSNNNYFKYEEKNTHSEQFADFFCSGLCTAK